MGSSRVRTLALIALAIVVAGLISYKASPTPSGAPNAAVFGGVSLKLDYATTSPVRQRGLSGRTEVPEGYGMLFVFPKDDFHGFWMKDMLVPIDIFWLDAQGHVVSIARQVATSTYPNVLYPSMKARYVLETVAGFADANRIRIGTPLLLKNLPTVSE